MQSLRDFTLDSIQGFLRATGATALWNYLSHPTVEKAIGVDGAPPDPSVAHMLPTLLFRAFHPDAVGQDLEPNLPIENPVSFENLVETYESAVMEWQCNFNDDWWGQQLLSQQELKDKIAAASAETTCNLYAHHDFKRRMLSTSVSFACEHGRERFDDSGDRSRKKGLDKKLEEVDVASTGRRFRDEKRPAPAHTNLRRSKYCECPYRFVLSTDDIKKGSPSDAAGKWSLSEHKSAQMCSVHIGHPKPAHSVGRVKGVIRDTVLQMSEAGAEVQSIISKVLSEHRTELSPAQVKWAIKRQNDKTKAINRQLSGGVVEFLSYLQSLPSVSYRLLLQDAQTDAVSQCDEHGHVTPTTFSTSDERAGPDDVKRLVNINDNVYFVHAVAWADATDVNMFEHYPEVLVVDTMHKCNQSHNLLNVLSIDGALLNNAVMRAYIPNGTKAMYRWALGTALPSLVPKAALRKVQAIMSDSDPAMAPVIDSLTASDDIMPNAYTMRCMWHMLDKNLADRFGGCGSHSWQSRTLALLYRLQRCDSEDELKYCIAFVLSSLAAEEELGGAGDAKRRELVEFVLARLNKCEKWIRCYFKDKCTRGIKASQRVEVDFSVMARRMGINARLTWATTAERLMRQQARRHRDRQRWITVQMTGTLLRDCTTASCSTITQAQLQSIDKCVLQPSLLTRTAIMKKVGHFSKARASPRMCEKHAACLDLHLMPDTRMRSAC